MKEIENLDYRPFTRFCMSIAAVPSSYIAGLTIEEQLLWFCSYLEKEVIPAVNNNGEAVEELQGLFTELHDYVEHYFDNLDVQDEINNKLDAMAEGGELEAIIAAYLQTKAVLCFDSVANLKLAENLTNGTYVKTLGFHTLNDGGSATYKIRTITNSDVVNEMTILSLHNENLVAELIVNLPLNPLILGAYGDGTHDDSTVLNYCFNDLLLIYKSLDLKGKIYGVNNTIEITENISNTIIKNGTIKALSTFNDDYLLEFPGDFESETVPNTGYMVIDSIIMNDIYLDCNNQCSGIKLIGFLKFKMNNITVWNYTTYGIHTTRANAHELNISNSFLFTNENEAIGLEINNNDNMVNNMVIKGGKIGIHLNNQVHCNQFNQIHIYGIVTENSYKKGIVLEPSASNNILNSIYFDGCCLYSKAYYGVELYDSIFLECFNGIIVIDSSSKIDNFIVDNCYVYFTTTVATNTYVFTILNNSQDNVTRNNKAEIYIQGSGTIIDNSNVIALTRKNHYNYFNIPSDSTKYELNASSYVFENPQTSYDIDIINNTLVVNSFNSAGYHWYGYEAKLDTNTDYLITDLLKENVGAIKVVGVNGSIGTTGIQGTVIKAGSSSINFMKFNTQEYDHILICNYGASGTMAPYITKII